MAIQFSMLLSDWLLLALFLSLIIYIIYAAKRVHLRQSWKHVFSSKIGMICCAICFWYFAIAIMDSVHFNSAKTNVSIRQQSFLDFIIQPLGVQSEKTYSAPFATHLYNKSHDFERLQYAGRQLTDIHQQKIANIFKLTIIGIIYGSIIAIFLFIIFIVFYRLLFQLPWYNFLQQLLQGKTQIAWREGILTLAILLILTTTSLSLSKHYHIFGTDKIGQDVFYLAIKSIRTGVIIGTITTLFMLPLALFLGTLAGYFGGWIDDSIQYLYITLSSIPGVLLISASILVLQVFISTHEHWFPTMEARADARLLALCFILGITTWATLCRLLRAETLKIRQLEYIQAARALGVQPVTIIWRHILPNAMHIVLITVVLDFSLLVLAEAVLSYVGVGVDPTTYSWGNMINSSRLELAREPVVWWPLLAAFVFMFILVLSANLFADKVRDAFDPRIIQEKT